MSFSADPRDVSMLKEWQVTYREELAQVRAEEKKAKAKAKGKARTRTRARATARALKKVKKAKETIERPSVTGIYRRHLQHIPNVIQVRTFRAWVGKGYRFAALASGGKSNL